MKYLRIFLLPVAGLLISCGGEKLRPLDQSTEPLGYLDLKAEFCTMDPQSVRQKMKYIFLVDHSSSNKPRFENTLVPDDVVNTDADGFRRYSYMVRFLNDLAATDQVELVSTAMVRFHSTADIVTANNDFEPDVTRAITTARDTWIGAGTDLLPSPEDAGFTNYRDALHAAYALILRDAQREALLPNVEFRSEYQIVLITDGIPNVADPNSPTGVYTQNFATDLEPVISAIMDLRDRSDIGRVISNISLNTGYYFNEAEVPGSRALLTQMANAGNGRFLSFGGGQAIRYSQYSVPERVVQNRLVDVFIDNLNANWWMDGTFRIDSDADGLPDFIELEQQSQTHMADTDGNGVSDFVEYKVRGSSCAGDTCSPGDADPYAICDGFSPIAGADGRVIFPSTLKDGLNDCERFLLSASLQSFSTNQNYVPDFYSIKNSVPFVVGTGMGIWADPFGDGLSNYMKLKLGYPLQISKSNLPRSFRERVTTLIEVASVNPRVQCFDFTVKNIAAGSQRDQIKIMIVENTSVFENKPILRSVTRSAAGRPTVTFARGDF